MLFARTPLQSKRSRSDTWTRFMMTGDENLYLLPRERLRTGDLRSIEVAVFSVDRSPGPAGTAGSTGVCRAEERAGVTIIQARPRSDKKVIGSNVHRLQFWRPAKGEGRYHRKRRDTISPKGLGSPRNPGTSPISAGRFRVAGVSPPLRRESSRLQTIFPFAPIVRG